MNLSQLGNLESVYNTPMDFNLAKTIGDEIDSDFKQLKFTGGYDHCYLLNKQKDGLEKQAILSSKKTNITMEVYTDAVGVQFYAGNFIDNVKGKNNVVYIKRSGICLETGFLPDSMNQENFESPILKVGKEYKTTTIYKFV